MPIGSDSRKAEWAVIWNHGLEHPLQQRLELMLLATQCLIYLRARGWEKVSLTRFTLDDNHSNRTMTYP